MRKGIIAHTQFSSDNSPDLRANILLSYDTVVPGRGFSAELRYNHKPG